MKVKAIVSVIGTPSLKKGGVYDTADFTKEDQEVIKGYLLCGHVIEIKERKRRVKKVEYR